MSYTESLDTLFDGSYRRYMFEDYKNIIDNIKDFCLQIIKNFAEKIMDVNNTNTIYHTELIDINRCKLLLSCKTEITYIYEFNEKKCLVVNGIIYYELELCCLLSGDDSNAMKESFPTHRGQPHILRRTVFATKSDFAKMKIVK